MSHDPIPAVGDGADVFDAPSLFYLTNRRLIDEWASLRGVAAQAVSQWLGQAFRDQLAHEVSELGLIVSYARGPGSFHHVVAYPDGMAVIGTKPVVGVGLGWSAKKVDPATSGSMFACVRVSRNKTGRAAAGVFLDNGGREFRVAHALRGGDSDAWPLFKNLQSPDRWWTDLDSLRDRLTAETMTLIRGLLPALHHAASVEDQGGPDETD